VISLKKVLVTLFTILAFATTAIAAEAPKAEVQKPAVVKKETKKAEKPVLKNQSSAQKVKKKK
jgi:hypothetical protein